MAIVSSTENEPHHCDIHIVKMAQMLDETSSVGLNQCGQTREERNGEPGL